MLISWLLNSASSISNADVMVAEFCYFDNSATFNSSFATVNRKEYKQCDLFMEVRTSMSYVSPSSSSEGSTRRFDESRPSTNTRSRNQQLRELLDSTSPRLSLTCFTPILLKVAEFFNRYADVTVAHLASSISNAYVMVAEFCLFNQQR
ncbi:obtusifoliol 14-alpha demethylase-like [Dorcoceras hygrometricum]|uniref:Obtusifoliol 14-alpha demethylase-like n=1 Tax=Dorcoceras hygrometricum TaxID=472368 RepID=A0A2Z7ABS9_9LAMI|nr:obtusifoliol 14-alpha demethylase-like [Dorcoceras hygrometricum]